MSLALESQLQQQVISKFRHSYVRYDALLGLLSLDKGTINGVGGCPALQHFAAQCGSSVPSNGTPNGYATHPQNGKHPGSCCDTFVGSLAAEVDRVRLFIASHLEELWVQLVDNVGQLQALASGGLAQGSVAVQPSATEALHSIELSLDAFGEELCLIERFARQNVVAGALLAQMKDQQASHSAPGGSAGLTVEGPYLGCMEQLLLGEAPLDPLVLGLSDAYELLRALRSHATGSKDAKWVPPEKFQRLTRKFWLQPADVTKFKCQLIKHLPVLIFGDRRKLTEVNASTAPSFLVNQRDVHDWGVVSSVYYDNPERLNTYHTRLRKEDYATAVRVRWYNDRSLAGDQQLFVERKVHRDSWSGVFSHKDRAPLQQQFLSEYMAGVSRPPGMDGDTSQAEVLREVQEYVTENQQVPLLRTVYRRTAFQKSSDNVVRISMDTHLQMIQELGAARVPGDWCRDMSAPLQPDDVVQFPYAVVEIKLQAKPPQWIKDLVQSGILLPLPRFSKFLHGVGALFQSQTEQLPNWFLPDEANPDLMTPATWEEMADNSDEHLKSAASWLFPSSFDPPAPGASPFSFLRRNKTAPPAPARRGTSRSAAVATARQITEFELACERLPDAESAPSDEGGSEGPASREGSRHGVQGLLQLGGPVGAAAMAPPAGAALPAGLVQRRETWPLMQHAGPSGGGFLPASYAALGFAGAGGQPAVGAEGAASYSTHSVYAVSNPLLQQERQQQGVDEEASSSTQVDSAKDIESGRPTTEDDKLLLAPLPPPLPVQQQLGVQQRSATPVPSAFGSQLYKQLGSGSGSEAAKPGASGGTKKVAPNRAAALVRTRVEPKTFFANERTFLQWLQISVLVMMIAFALLSGSLVTAASGVSGASGAKTGCPKGDSSCVASKVSGAIIAPVALLFMAYSLFMYKKRTIQILRRETVRYDDQRGPVFLVGILLFVMIVAYVVTMVWTF